MQGAGMYIKVEKGPGLSLVYTDESGNRHVKKGGDKNWRCNNPGNLKEGRLTAANGAIGSYHDERGTWAVFPSHDVGLAALKAWFTGSGYGDETIYTAMGKYIDVAKAEDYRPSLESRLKAVGVNIHKVHCKDLSAEALDILAATIEMHEGGHAGEEFDQKKMVGAHEKKHVITEIQVDGAGYASKGEVSSEIESGNVDGVAVVGATGAFVRQRPNSTSSDNLDEIATPEDS